MVKKSMKKSQCCLRFLIFFRQCSSSWYCVGGVYAESVNGSSVEPEQNWGVNYFRTKENLTKEFKGKLSKFEEEYLCEMVEKVKREKLDLIHVELGGAHLFFLGIWMIEGLDWQAVGAALDANYCSNGWRNCSRVKSNGQFWKQKRIIRNAITSASEYSC